MILSVYEISRYNRGVAFEGDIKWFRLSPFMIVKPAIAKWYKETFGKEPDFQVYMSKSLTEEYEAEYVIVAEWKLDEKEFTLMALKFS